MSKLKNISELEEIVKRFCVERDWDQFHSPKDLAIGISTEAAELLELFRFKSDSEITEKLLDSNFKIKMENELADILFFVLRFSQMNNVNLQSALIAKIALNEQKYPVDKAKGSNKKYDEA